MKTILSLLVLAVFTLGTIRADEPNQPVAEPVAKTEKVKTGKTLTYEDLGDMLDTMGFNPKPVKNDAGEADEYTLEYTSETWTLRHRVVMSKDKSVIWLVTTVLYDDGKTAVPAEVLQQFLVENGNIGSASVCYVQYKDGTGAYILCQRIANQNVIPGPFRKSVGQFGDAIKVMVKARDKGQTEAKARIAATTKVAGKDTPPTSPIVP